MNLALMRLIDQQFLETPFYGVQQMTWRLRNEGHAVNQKRIRRLMRLMRLMPIYQKPDTSRPAKGHETYPYLLGGLRVERPNQVWCADITYLPMRNGFLYLVAIMDWRTRKVLAWRISNTLEADFCVEALNEAIHKAGPPEIMNTDQGSQFTSFARTDRLNRVGARISMDGNPTLSKCSRSPSAPPPADYCPMPKRACGRRRCRPATPPPGTQQRLRAKRSVANARFLTGIGKLSRINRRKPQSKSRSVRAAESGHFARWCEGR